MRNVTDDEVIFIDHDLSARGIVLGELRDNLIDHICCIIEHESDIEEDFYKCYERVLPQFFKEELQEIQTETDNLLQFKNFYTMKKIMNISGISTVFLILAGTTLKTLHMPGAAVTLLLGGFTFAFLFLPILIIIKFKDDESKTDKAVFSLGLLLAMVIATGFIFKIMHWPFANNLMFGGTTIFTLFYVPLYFFTRIRRPEVKFNTIVNSVIMLAFGGILYTLFDLSYSKKYESEMQEIHYYLHDNSIRLFEINEDMYAVLPSNSQSNDLRSKTSEVNKNIEIMAELISKRDNTDGLNTAVPELEISLKNYNTYINSLNNSAVKTIENSGLVVIHKINTDLAMNVLARVQQQLAVNENAFLSKQLAAK
jgi:cytochrome c biogenesis protein CcdA